MAKLFKHLVSKNKRRYQDDDYDLDLTYITANIVAMGFPSDKIEAFYRNKHEDVVNFFDSRHSDHYKVYNLCSERKYDPIKFHNRVAEYPFEDHNAPRFEMLKPCCEDINEWIHRNDKNVVAIHCKAGKGRTGVIICSYLLHCGDFSETKDALQYYGERRTQNAKGVTIPSQRRYVYYYSHLLKNKLLYTPTPLLLKSITLVEIPNFSNGTCNPVFIVRQGQGAKIHESDMSQITKTDKEIKYTFSNPLPICGDMRIECIHLGKIGKEKMFQFWFNTFFVYNHCPTEEEEYEKAKFSSSDTNLGNENRKKNILSDKVSFINLKKPSTNSACKSFPESLSENSIVNNSEINSISPPQRVTSTKKSPNRNSHRRSVGGEELLSHYIIPERDYVLNLPKAELDRAHKDKRHYPDNFRIKARMSNPMKQEDIADALRQGPDFTYEFDSDDPDLDEDYDDDDDVMAVPIVSLPRNPPKSITIPPENETRRNHSNAITSPVQVDTPSKGARRKIQSKSNSIDNDKKPTTCPAEPSDNQIIKELGKNNQTTRTTKSQPNQITIQVKPISSNQSK